MLRLGFAAILLAAAAVGGEAEGLRRTIDVVLVRAPPAEVADLLRLRCGVTFALTAAAARTGQVTIGPAQFDVANIIAETARQAGLTLVVRGDEAFGSLTADPQRLVALRRQASTPGDGRLAAIRALAQTGDNAVVADLTHLLGSDDTNVRLAAIAALSDLDQVIRLGPPPGLLSALLAARTIMPAYAMPTWLRLIDACGTSDAEAALLADRRYQPQMSAGRAALAAAAKNPATWEVCAAIPSSRLRAHRDVLPDLRSLIRATDAPALMRLRMAAGDTDLLRMLLTGTTAADAMIRRATVTELALSTSASAETRLIALLRDPDDMVRTQVATQLCERRHAAPAIDVLLAMLRGGKTELDWRRRAAVLHGLSRQPGLGHDPRLLPAILAWIDHDPLDGIGADHAAAAALAALRSPASLEVLKQRLAMASPWARNEAVTYASLARDPSVLPLLLPLVRDPAPYIASHAATTLAKLPLSAEGWAAVHAAMADALPEARESMAAELAADPRWDHPLADLLDRWCEDPDPAVKQRAVMARNRRAGTGFRSGP